MDTNKLMIISEQTVIDFLTAFKPMSLANVLTMLSRIRTMGAIHQVYRELQPKQAKKVLGEPRDWFALGLHDPEKIQTSFVRALADMFPIEQDPTDEMLFADYSDRGYGGFYPAGIGPCLSWDLVDEILSDIPSVNGWLSLPLFFGALANEFDQDAWRVLAKHFRWPFRNRPSLPDGFWYFSDRKLKRLLTRNGMKKFWIAWQVCAEDTGVIFFDVNPNSETNFPELIEATPQNIRTLAIIWKRKGKAMYLEYTKALDQVEANPHILIKLFDLMVQAIVLSNETEKGNNEYNFENTDP